MPATLDNDPHLKKIYEFLHKSTGFDAHQYKMNYIKRRVAVRMRATGALTYPDYLKVLQTHPGEHSLLFLGLTIHVTEFFRDPKLYRVLKENILPDLSARAFGKKIRVWCAGCSTGEEAYSLALLMEGWREISPGFSVEIQATDIDAPSVRTAEKGEYSLESLREIPKDLASRGFKADGAKVKVVEEARKRVRFHVQDLLGDWGGGWGGFDLISCRNLLIYLAPAQQQKLYARFFRALRPGGYLILGLTETILGESRGLFRCVDLKNRIYQAEGAPGPAMKGNFHG